MEEEVPLGVSMIIGGKWLAREYMQIQLIGSETETAVESYRYQFILQLVIIKLCCSAAAGFLCCGI
ncbi:hypothetical protein M413DRAFT_442616 [Hebeloma cylindrosporum]|uniref:Uncharacterized protein n=1 Tax=Hebeloma cylindrosporum TaxID=76867 RepID=A0A0C3CLN4_HEBCY|nr:hypothetical protein M413DRAFT_442616 [Hebeloma cylindrosporum h7]